MSKKRRFNKATKVPTNSVIGTTSDPAHLAIVKKQPVTATAISREAALHAAFDQAYRRIVTAARTDTFKTFQDNISVVGQRPEILVPPTVFNKVIEFNRFLFRKEPRVSAAIDTLVETASIKRIQFTRIIDDEFHPAGNKRNDIFVTFLNWFFNDYIFFDRFQFPFIFNRSLLDWFIAGNIVLYAGSSKEKFQLGEKTFYHPTALTPIAPEYLYFQYENIAFGVPNDTFEIRIPTQLLDSVLKNEFVGKELRKSNITLDANTVYHLKRMATLSEIYGKSIIESVHDPVRMKYQKRLDKLTRDRMNQIHQTMFVKYGETGIGEEGYREQEELEALSATIAGQIANGAAAIVVPPDVTLERAAKSEVNDTYVGLDKMTEEDLDIQIGLRIFNAFLGGASGQAAGTKDLTLAIMNDRIEKNNLEILDQSIPRLINVLAVMNKSVLKSENIDTRGIRYKVTSSQLNAGDFFSRRLQEWERGIVSTEEYLGTEYNSMKLSRQAEKESGEDTSIFTPRQLPHTLSPAETGKDKNQPTDTAADPKQTTEANPNDGTKQ